MNMYRVLVTRDVTESVSITVRTKGLFSIECRAIDRAEDAGAWERCDTANGPTPYLGAGFDDIELMEKGI